MAAMSANSGLFSIYAGAMLHGGIAAAKIKEAVHVFPTFRRNLHPGDSGTGPADERKCDTVKVFGRTAHRRPRHACNKLLEDMERTSVPACTATRSAWDGFIKENW